MIRVCFVCLGNICRSPTAEGVFRALVTREGLTEHVTIVSRGTGDWHAGELPDPRTRATAQKRGVALTSRAAVFKPSDFETYDWIVPMDHSNRKRLLALAPSEAAKTKIHMFRAFEEGASQVQSPDEHLEVPDPYYGEQADFDEVFDICERASRGLLAFLRQHHGV